MDHTAMRRLTGPCEAADLPGGVLRLRADGPPRWTLYLRGLRAGTRAEGAPASLAAARLRSIEWSARGPAEIQVDLDGGPAAFRADLAILHEPLAELYAGLPLARYDEPARRFWTRVMRIARWPGGAWLLRRFARRR